MWKDIHPVKGAWRTENCVLALCRQPRKTAGVDAPILATSLGRQTATTAREQGGD